MQLLIFTNHFFFLNKIEVRRYQLVTILKTRNLTMKNMFVLEELMILHFLKIP